MRFFFRFFFGFPQAESYCCSIFPLVRTDYNQQPFIKQPVEDQDSPKSFIKQAVEDHIIEPVFAFALHGEGLEGQGQLHLGLIKNDYVSHDLEYHDCVADSPFWMIDKATITIGKYKVENVKTVFDTASRFVRGPPKEVAKIYESIERVDFTYLAEEGIYLSTPSSLKSYAPEITFQWGNGKRWTIPSER